MNILEPQSFETICKTALRLPFKDTDVRQMRVHFEAARRAGLDLRIQTEISDFAEMVREGIFLLQSRDLKSDFLLINVDAGRGFFGGQKRRVLSYTSDIYLDHFSSGPVLESPIRVLVGINNLYRATGLLRGSAL